MTTYAVYLTRTARERATRPAIAEATGLSGADVGLILNSKAPRALAVGRTKHEVREVVGQLRAVGLDAFAVAHDALNRFAPTPIHQVNRVDGRLVLASRQPLPLSIEVDRLSTIVLGRILHRSEINVEGSRPTVVSGLDLVPMGVSRGGVVERRSISSSDEAFLCLFANEPFVILESDFNYRASLDKVALTREGSFRAVLAMIRDAMPQAAFDDTLHRFPAAVPETAESRARIIFDENLAESRVTTTTGSNETRVLQAAYLIHLQSGRQA